LGKINFKGSLLKIGALTTAMLVAMPGIAA
jgi:hypothetical protein